MQTLTSNIPKQCYVLVHNVTLHIIVYTHVASGRTHCFESISQMRRKVMGFQVQHVQTYGYGYTWVLCAPKVLVRPRLDEVNIRCTFESGV